MNSTVGTMLIQIREEDVTPVYLQVINQVREQIASGKLKPGERLPSVRELARFLDINVNTVQKSYQGLKQMGLLVIRPARGAIVSHKAPDVLGSAQNERLLKEALVRVMKEARRLGFDKDAVLRLLRDIEAS